MAHPADSPSGAQPLTENVTVAITPYSPATGAVSWWEDDAVLRLEVWDSPEPTVVVSGNPAGLVSMARHLLTLAHASVPDGRHMDVDNWSGWLAEDSLALRIEVEKR